MTTTLDTIVKMQQQLNEAIASLVAETYCQQETAPAAESTPTSTNKEVKSSKKPRAAKSKSRNKESNTVNNDIRYVDTKSVRAALTHRACGERIPQWFLAGQTTATLKAMLAAPAGQQWGHRSGCTIVKVDSGAAKLNRERRKVAEPTPAKVVRSASAPTPKATSKVDMAVATIAADKGKVWTPESLAEASGLTVREARTQLNNLVGAKCTERHVGKVLRVLPGRYVAA